MDPPVITPRGRPPLPPLPPRPGVVTNPRWIRQAMPEFPEIAKARGVARGLARLECTAGVNSRLSNCVLLHENPPGVGFGAAALKGAERAIVEPRLVDGVPTPSQVTFNVDFRLMD